MEEEVSVEAPKEELAKEVVKMEIAESLEAAAPVSDPPPVPKVAVKRMVKGVVKAECPDGACQGCHYEALGYKLKARHSCSRARGPYRRKVAEPVE